MTKEQLSNLPVNAMFHHKTLKNADGTPMRFRKNGQLQTWKTRPEEFRLPVKYGLHGCKINAITHENAGDFELAK